MTDQRRSHHATAHGRFSDWNLLRESGVIGTNLVERTAMRRYVVAAAVVALVLPAVAAAKGPVSVTISGPGLDRSLAIAGDGEGPGTALGTLAAASGYFPQMFGQSPDPTLASRPKATLGPRYRAVYLVPGPNDVQSRVVQLIYPYAKPVALTFMKPGQRFWDGRRAHGGWYRASARLKAVLVRAGLPATRP
jgi:uncharacterized protein (DUF58 family)